MRRPLLFLLAMAAILVLPPAWGGELDGTFRGTALIRTDAGHRIVVVLDADADGLADDAFLFEPRRPLAKPIVPFTKDVVIRAEDADLELHALDRSVSLRLSTTLPRHGEPSASTVGTTTTAYGLALAHYKVGGASLAEVDTDDIETLAGAELPCGGSDVDCTSGRQGSLACGGGCPTGGGSQAGITLTVAGGNLGVTKTSTPPCSTTCADGYYSCCRCDTGAAETQPTPKCTCRSNASLQPCRGPDAAGQLARPRSPGRWYDRDPCALWESSSC